MMSRLIVLLLTVTAGWFLQLERTEGFEWVITPRFRMEFIGALPGLDGGELFFIANNKPTPILAVQLSSGLLSFDQRYTHVLMDWFRQTPLEVVDYVMTVSSLNTTILAPPIVTGVPLVGQVEAIAPKFNTFNTSLVCLAKGITTLEVELVYNVTTYANTTINDTSSVRKKNYTAILRVRKECDDPPPTPSATNSLVAGWVIPVAAVAGVLLLLLIVLLIGYYLKKRSSPLPEKLGMQPLA